VITELIEMFRRDGFWTLVHNGVQYEKGIDIEPSVTPRDQQHSINKQSNDGVRCVHTGFDEISEHISTVVYKQDQGSNVYIPIAVRKRNQEYGRQMMYEHFQKIMSLWSSSEVKQ